jgi:CcmD family protein
MKKNLNLHNRNRILTTVLFFTVFQNFLLAQSHDQDFLRSTGKIYSVVVAVVLIFLGIAYYLWRLDKKLTKLENQINEHKTS